MDIKGGTNHPPMYLRNALMAVDRAILGLARNDCYQEGRCFEGVLRLLADSDTLLAELDSEERYQKVVVKDAILRAFRALHRDQDLVPRRVRNFLRREIAAFVCERFTNARDREVHPELLAILTELSLDKHAPRKFISPPEIHTRRKDDLIRFLKEMKEALKLQLT